MDKKTHYRTFSNSKHLASDDLLGLDYIRVTIDKAFTGQDANKKKAGPVPILTFKQKQIRPNEPLKSMILNMTNMKMLEDITGSPYLEDWANVEIEIYVANNVRLGSDLVDGLRIRRPPQQQSKKTLRDEVIDRMAASINAGAYNLEALASQYEYTEAQHNALTAKIEELRNGTQDQM